MGDHWETGRMEAFSDGVFAIAITLLILEISVPESAFEDLWSGIADQWPSYLAYVTSFLTIGGIWAAHHGIFRRLAYANKRLMLVNLRVIMKARNEHKRTRSERPERRRHLRRRTEQAVAASPRDGDVRPRRRHVDHERVDHRRRR